MASTAVSSSAAGDEVKFTSFALAGINVVGSSCIPASSGRKRSHPDGSPSVAVGLAPYDVMTGPEKTKRRNLGLYNGEFLLLYLVFDTPVTCAVAQTYSNRLSDTASVWFMHTGDYEHPLVAMPLRASIADAIRYSDLVQPPLQANPMTGETPNLVELLTRNLLYVGDSSWDCDRTSCWQVLINSQRLSAAVHFLWSSMNSYWTDLIYWWEERKFGVPEPEIDRGFGDPAHQNAFRCVEEVFGGRLPKDERKARLKLQQALRGYGVDPATLWKRMDDNVECDIVDAIIHVQSIRNDKTAHGGIAYKAPLREAEILDAQYLARFLLVLCSQRGLPLRGQ